MCPYAPLLRLVIVFLFMGTLAVLLIAFPLRWQSLNRACYRRYPWARSFTLSLDYQLMTDPSWTWAVRLMGFVVLVPVAFLAALITKTVSC